MIVSTSDKKKDLILWCFISKLLIVQVLLKSFASKHDKALEDAKPVLEALKSKGISAVGAVGFCYGGELIFPIWWTLLFIL